MSTALVHSRAQLGLNAPAVSVEVHLPSGLPAFVTTGINGRELRDRVKSAIQNSVFDFPAGRIVVNLGPAELLKSGGRYDLAIAAGILIASEQLPANALEGYSVLGELSLFGDVRDVRGALTAGREARQAGEILLCPKANGQEFNAADASGVRLVSHLNQLAQLDRLRAPATDDGNPQGPPKPAPNPLAAVVGQERAKRALTIAAAGGHHMLMSGPPGAGKTMLAERLADLLPPLKEPGRSEVAELYSLSGLPVPKLSRRPFRAPHHSASSAALTGGGSPPMPGEISHAHQGVLFLDEMPEFRRDLIEALREPLESGVIRLNRRGFAVEYPARFQLVAAMNPCPVGLVCNPLNCRCPPDQALRYRNRLSAPILDRIDLHIDVQAVPVSALITTTRNEAQTAASAAPDSEGLSVADPVPLIMRAQQIQRTRNRCLNAHLDQEQTKAVCQCSEEVKGLLESSAEQLNLSARGYFRTLRVARTICDLDSLSEVKSLSGDDGWSEVAQQPTLGAITAQAIAEALSYRALGPEGS